MGKTKKQGLKNVESNSSIDSVATTSSHGSSRSLPRPSPSPMLSTVREVPGIDSPKEMPAAPSNSPVQEVQFESRYSDANKTSYKQAGSGLHMHTRAGLVFPCLRILRAMEKAKLATKVQKG
jgi:hypothetical protein